MMYGQRLSIIYVALRKESVDRNRTVNVKKTKRQPVALRKESVDRNKVGIATIDGIIVALRKESVDRNKDPKPAN